MGAWRVDALSSANELARRRGQVTSTAHVLVALSRSEPSVLWLCAQFGLRDAALVAELVFVDESANSIALVIERAKKLAAAMGMHRVFPLHLLHVLAHEPHCASNRVLSRLDVAPRLLSQAALDALEGAALRSATTVAEYDFEGSELARRNHASTQGQSRLQVAVAEHQRQQARANGRRLGDEVEKRLPRRGARPVDRPPPTFADEVEAKLRRRH
jgi:hypothetical protein